MNRALLVAVFTANLGGLLLGFGIAVVNGAMPFLTMEFQLDSVMHGWIVNSTLIGSLFGALFIGRLSDFSGRRPMLIFMALLFLFSAIGTGVISSFVVFLIFRFITGIAIGGTAVLASVYISELSPPNNRGRLSASFPFAIVTGILLAFFSDYLLIDTGANNWRYMFLVCAFPALLFLLFLYFGPESPRYLMQRGLEHETDVVIRRINPEIDKYGFMQEFKKIVNTRLIASNANLFKQPHLKILGTGFALGMFCQLTGINAVLYYSADFFRSAGFPENHVIQQVVIIGLISLVFTIVAMTMIDRVGRKKLLLVGSAGMAVCLSLFAILFMAGIQEGQFMFPLLIVFFGFFSVSQGTVFWVLLPEMFSNNIRIRGASIGLFSFLFFNIVTSFLIPGIASNYAIGTLFLFYALATIGSFFFFRKYLVETKRKTLEEMGQ
jgi:sugar porter (SP) family MFS transporter